MRKNSYREIVQPVLQKPFGEADYDEAALADLTSLLNGHPDLEYDLERLGTLGFADFMDDDDLVRWCSQPGNLGSELAKDALFFGDRAGVEGCTLVDFGTKNEAAIEAVMQRKRKAEGVPLTRRIAHCDVI